nr:TetR/AcrR family transcriptional regulator [uncultured Rhodococcus sp.]
MVNEFENAAASPRDAPVRRHAAHAPRVGDRRRSLILDSIEKLLATVRIADLSMDSIAKASSISRSGIYFYFANKFEALDALIDRATDELRIEGHPKSAEESVEDFAARLVSAAVHGWKAHKDTFAAAVEMASTTTSATPWRMIMQEFARIIADAILAEDHERMTDDVAQQRGEIVCWMIERNLYMLFAREHTTAERQLLARELERAAVVVIRA